MLNLNETGVELFIRKARNINPFWDNYDLIIWRKDSSGFYDKKGLYKNNSWGKAEIIKVGVNGAWRLPRKYVKYFK